MGVTKQGSKWIARVSWKGEQLYLGRHEEKEEAELACSNKLTLLKSGSEKPNRGRYSDSRGISFDGKKWLVKFVRKGKKYYLGMHDTEKLAIEARDTALEKLRKGEPVKSTARKKSSKYKGVTLDRMENGERFILIHATKKGNTRRSIWVIGPQNN